MKITEPIEGQHYFIQDLGVRVELTSTLFRGMVAGIMKLSAGGYEILYDSCTIIGNMYVIPALKPKETEGKDTGENKYEIKELQQENEVLKKETYNLKSQNTRLRNKAEKLENQLKDKE